MARASEASSDSGTSGRARSVRTMTATRSLTALPLPTTAFLTVAGGNSVIGRSRMAAARRTTARPSPIRIALWTDFP
jgi:hypothetical protein